MTERIPQDAPGLNPVVALQLVAAKTRDLPLMPVVALKALQMVRDPDVSLRELQRVIAADQALSARILRIVNSAMYCLRREVSTVSHAVTILGLETIRSILMAAVVEKVFRDGFGRGHDLGTKLLMEHSWGTALAARHIVLRLRSGNPEEAFLCGLMHDIGKPVLLRNFPEQYMEIFNEAYRGASGFHQAELKTFGFSHSHVGAFLAEKWNFPSQLAEAIGYHHNPLAAPAHVHLTCVVNLANLMMASMEIGVEKDKALVLEEQPSAEFLGLGKAALESIAAEVGTAFARLIETMNC